jgi:hypothetical protein
MSRPGRPLPERQPNTAVVNAVSAGGLVVDGPGSAAVAAVIARRALARLADHR